MSQEIVPLRLYLFGSVRIEINGVAVNAPLARKEFWLLALLALRQNRPVDRDHLVGLFWSDCAEEQARYNLRRSLSKLRAALGEQGERLEPVKPRSLRFVSDGAFIDALEFDRLAGGNDRELLCAAATLYRAPLLQDCYEDWVLPERYPREFAYQRVLETLAGRCMADEDWPEAERYARLWIATDPLQERAHRLLMEVLARSGNHARATTAYRDLRLRLREEVNADPDPETSALAQAIREQARQIASPPATPSLAGQPPPNPAAAATGAVAPRYNAPSPLTRLIGRELDLAAAEAHLRRGRLISFVGIGGVGKTRMALELAQKVHPGYTAGAVFVELAAIGEGNLVVGALASASDVTEEAGKPLLTTLCARLRDKTILLLLDNCEHLLSAVADVCRVLLAQCPFMRIVTTTRQALGVPGEVVLPVSPLPLPPALSGRSWDYPKAEPSELLAYPSVQLFLERAYQACPELRLGPRELEAVGRICCRLDGIPLALELAASRVRALSLGQIAARLEDRLRLLDRGVRTENPHQRTLRGLLDWSFRLLEEPEKRLFAQLSIFSGGATLEAIEAITGDGEETLELVAGLVDKSLLITEQRQGRQRYRMLETVRQYATEKLAAASEEPLLKTRHRDWYLAFITECNLFLGGPEQADWLNIIEAEHDNLRQALTFCLHTPGEAEAGLRLADAMYDFWLMRCHRFEARERYANLLAHPELQQPTRLRAQTLNAAGVFAWRQGDYAAAHALYREGLALRRELGDRSGIGRSLSNLGLLASYQGDYTTARELYTESLAIKRELGEKRSIAHSLNGLGLITQEQGDYATARSYYEESLTIWREFGDRACIAGALCNLATVAHLSGDHKAAKPLYEESLAMWREVGDPTGVAMLLTNLALVFSLEGDDSTAVELHGEALAIYREAGDRAGCSKCCVNLGNLACKRGDYPLARSLVRESLTIKHEMGDKLGIAVCLEAYCRLAMQERHLEMAAQWGGSAERLREEIGAPVTKTDQAASASLVAGLRHELGEAAFLSAWSQGREAPLEQAIERALNY